MAKELGDDDLFPDEIDPDERYEHRYWDLPDPAAKELANLIMQALGELIRIALVWPRQYAHEIVVAREKRPASDAENEVLGEMFTAWIDFQGQQGEILKRIQAGNAVRAGDAWAKELLDALDTAHREFNSNPIDPSTSDEAARDGLQEEFARAKRFMKLADRLYDSYRELAYAYLVPETNTSPGPRPDINSLAPKYKGALELIKALDRPMKGILLAKKLNVSYDTFKKHYVKALKPFGLANEGDGYFIKSR